jgi:hypothetical protein
MGGGRIQQLFSATVLVVSALGADLTPESFQEQSRARILDLPGDAFGRPMVWCSPAFAELKVFVGDGRECVAVDPAR